MAKNPLYCTTLKMLITLALMVVGGIYQIGDEAIVGLYKYEKFQAIINCCCCSPSTRS